MSSFFKFRKIGVFFLGFLFCTLTSRVQAENFSEAPLGLMELKEFHEPVALFAPENYSKSKNRSLLIVIPATSDYSKAILGWMDLAKTKNLVVACSSIAIRDEDVPFKVDEWLINLKRELALRYNTDRVYLVGLGASANYTAYLGLEHPEEFDAVASIGGAWTGPLEKLTHLSDAPEKQTAFYVAMSESDPRVGQVQLKTKEMTAKGYQVRLVMLNVKGEEATDGFRSGVVRWFDEQASKTAALSLSNKNKQKTFKQKASQAFSEFFKV